jgi:4'-phosphopantetheinyl transferase
VVTEAGIVLAGWTAGIDVHEEWLTPAETARADALRKPSDRADYVAAHVLVRRCAARVLGVSPSTLTIEQHCPTCGESGHGRPSIAGAPEVHVSLSHTRGYVAAAADLFEIAVDVEHLIGADRVADLAAAVLTPDEREQVRTAAARERAFAALWVRKEALIKLGRADLDTLTTLDAATALAGYAVREWVDAGVSGVAVASRTPALEVSDRRPAG